MADDGGKELPVVLPPEEQEAFGAGAGREMALRESDFLTQSLSAHAVEAAGLRNELARAYIDNMRSDIDMRKKYAGRILKYLELYSGGVGLLLLADGFGPWGFNLADDVVTTLVGSTAVAAIGLVGFIARGLFRSPPPPPMAEEA